MIPKIDSVFLFPEQHQPVRLCYWEATYLLGRKNWYIICICFRFGKSQVTRCFSPPKSTLRNWGWGRTKHSKVKAAVYIWKSKSNTIHIEGEERRNPSEMHQYPLVHLQDSAPPHRRNCTIQETRLVDLVNWNVQFMQYKEYAPRNET
jgi:hypothetical protein